MLDAKGKSASRCPARCSASITRSPTIARASRGCSPASSAGWRCDKRHRPLAHDLPRQRHHDIRLDDTDSRVADPTDARRIFAWRISRTCDDKGNVICLAYGQENGAGLDLSAAHEANRTPAGRKAQTYLRKVLYGNLQPYFLDFTAGCGNRRCRRIGCSRSSSTTAITPPSPPLRPRTASWPVRPDPFSGYRSGFEVRTYRRVQRAAVFQQLSRAKPASAPIAWCAR